jgi:H+-transporting ATPase
MADAAHSSNNSSEAPNHLNTNIESGDFNEKTGHHDNDLTTTKKPIEDEEEDEDMDALIDDLESEDGHGEDEEEEGRVNAGTGRIIPEDQLQTDTRHGLTEAEVIARRKKYGMNQMKEEKENLILKFLGYFIGPIQFVMEVSFHVIHYIIKFPHLHLFKFLARSADTPAFLVDRSRAPRI